MTGTINVFAAASLQEAFTKLGGQFEAAHPGTKVVFNFGPSSGLAEQIGQGAPADVFASASTKNMDTVVASGDAATPRTSSRNTMEIAVPPENPAGITTLDDLAKKGVKVALCQAEVPVRRHRAEGVRQREHQGHSCHPGGRRQVDAEQGHPRRGRRRCRLCHRRAGGRRLGEGHRDPGRRQRLDHLPHRRADRVEEQDHCAGVRRLRAVPGRARVR